MWLCLINKEHECWNKEVIGVAVYISIHGHQSTGCQPVVWNSNLTLGGGRLLVVVLYTDWQNHMMAHSVVTFHPVLDFSRHSLPPAWAKKSKHIQHQFISHHAIQLFSPGEELFHSYQIGFEILSERILVVKISWIQLLELCFRAKFIIRSYILQLPVHIILLYI